MYSLIAVVKGSSSNPSNKLFSQVYLYLLF